MLALGACVSFFSVRLVDVLLTYHQGANMGTRFMCTVERHAHYLLLPIFAHAHIFDFSPIHQNIKDKIVASSETDTVHIFKLSGKGGNGGGPSRNGPSSPSSASIDSQQGSGAMEGGYEAFIDNKKKSGVR